VGLLREIHFPGVWSRLSAVLSYRKWPAQRKPMVSRDVIYVIDRWPLSTLGHMLIDDFCQSMKKVVNRKV